MGLTTEQLQVIATAMTTAMANFQKTNPSPSPAPVIINAAFKARNLGYFDPDNDVDAVESRDGKTIYHNVFTFTNRVKVKASTETPAIIRGNLNAYLLDKAER